MCPQSLEQGRKGRRPVGNPPSLKTLAQLFRDSWEKNLNLVHDLPLIVCQSVVQRTHRCGHVVIYNLGLFNGLIPRMYQF